MAFSSSVCTVQFFLLVFLYLLDREARGRACWEGTWRPFEICPGSLPVARRGHSRPSATAEKYASISVPLRRTCQHVCQRHESTRTVVTCTFDNSCKSPFLSRGCFNAVDPRLPARWTLIKISTLTNIFTWLKDPCRCPLHY